jgi:hypothetical protein
VADGTYRRLAAAVLIAHQRRDAASCLCGWSVLGESWAVHVAEVLEVAGALRVRPPAAQVHVAPPEDRFGAGLARGYEEGRRRD